MDNSQTQTCATESSPGCEERVEDLRKILLGNSAPEVLHHHAEDRYVAAALELFASVALMFWYVLQLFLSSED